jgi:hypothetical protein
VDFGLTDERVGQYRVTVTTHRGLSEAPIQSREVTSVLLQREYSRYTLTAELARYFQFDGISPFDIEEAINASKDGTERVIWAANLNNRIANAGAIEPSARTDDAARATVFMIDPSHSFVIRFRKAKNPSASIESQRWPA